MTYVKKCSQYLALDDKLRLECVSQQFQRTIFEKQIDLYIGDDPQNRVKSLQGILFDGHSCLNRGAFETLLKKCSKIRSVLTFGVFDVKWILSFEQIISLLNKYCNHLKRLDYYCFEIKDKISNEFIKKFGSKLVSLPQNWFTNIENLKYLPNIEELSIKDLLPTIPYLLDIEFKNLKKLNIENIYGVSDEIFISVLRHFQRYRLKYLELRYKPYLKETENIEVLTEFSKFEHLVHLRVYTNCYFEDLRVIFQNCTQLKSLITSLSIHSEDCSELKEMMSYLLEIKRFQRFEILIQNI